MCDKDGTILIGVSTQSIFTDADSESKKAFYKKQFGKYKPDRSYDFCWECWLDFLMGVK